MPHPTPAQIKYRVLKRFFEDEDECREKGEPLLPIRVYRLIDEGIAAANREARNESA